MLLSCVIQHDIFNFYDFGFIPSRQRLVLEGAFPPHTAIPGASPGTQCCPLRWEHAHPPCPGKLAPGPPSASGSISSGRLGCDEMLPLVSSGSSGSDSRAACTFIPAVLERGPRPRVGRPPPPGGPSPGRGNASFSESAHGRPSAGVCVPRASAHEGPGVESGPTLVASVNLSDVFEDPIS